MSAKDEAWAYVTGVARQDCVGCQMVANGETRRVKHTHDEHEDAAKDYAAECVAEARAPLVRALRAVEWVRHGCEYEKNSWCPACDTEEHYGHAPDCPLAAALAKGEDE